MSTARSLRRKECPSVRKSDQNHTTQEVAELIEVSERPNLPAEAVRAGDRSERAGRLQIGAGIPRGLPIRRASAFAV